MTILDYSIMAVVAALVGVGFFGGAFRVLIGFVAIYFSTLLSAVLYEELSGGIQDLVGSIAEPTANLISFLLLFLLLGVGLFLAIGQTLKAANISRSRFAILDNLGGAAIALTAGILTMAVTLSIAVIILGAFSQSSTAGGFENLGTLGREIRRSELIPRFLELQPPVAATFEIWFPNGLPPVLQPPPKIY